MQSEYLHVKIPVVSNI